MIIIFVPENLSLLMAIVYSMSPSMLYVGLHFINGSFISLWTGSVMVSIYDTSVSYDHYYHSRDPVSTHGNSLLYVSIHVICWSPFYQ